MRSLRLPQLQNVAPNQRVSLSIPLGVTYEKLYFWLGTNITTALITNLVLKINNREFIRWKTLTDMVSGLMAYKGNFTGNNQFFVIDFTERLAKEEVGMKLGTVAATEAAGVQAFTLEFDLGNYAAVATSTIEGWADVEAPSANRIILRVQHQEKVIGAAAEEAIYVPHGMAGQQVKRIVIKHANVESVRVRRDGVDIYESLPVARANMRLQDFGRVPQANYHVIDFMPDALQANAFNTRFMLVPGANGAMGRVPVQNVEVRVKTTAADALTVYTEAYALNDQL